MNTIITPHTGHEAQGKLKRSRRTVAAVVLVLAVAVAGVVLYRNLNKPVVGEPTGDQGNVPVPQTKTTVVQVPADQLPEGFPKDLPMDPAGEVLLNNIRYLESGAMQLQRQFVTQGNVQNVFKGYRDYLKATKWWIDTIDQEKEDIKSLVASKGADTFSVVVVRSPDGKTKVDLILVRHGKFAPPGAPTSTLQ